MKCPKCKYTAFDYLDACPRCGKDLTPEKAKLNISSVKPNPPSLLGSLTGDLDDGSVEVRAPGSIKESAQDMTLKGEEIYDDGSELDISIDEEPASGEGGKVELGNLGPSDEDSELDVDLAADKFSIDAAEGAREEKVVGKKESGLKQGGDRKNPEKKETEKDSEAIGLDLEDLDLKLDFDEDEDSGQ
jgi:hypothetical protein